MESQRSGILSTFIMTIPLVIVPALAIFRPPVPTSGFTSTDLGAADEAVQDDPLGEFDIEPMTTPEESSDSEEASKDHADFSSRRQQPSHRSAAGEMNTSLPAEIEPATQEHPSDPFSADGLPPEGAQHSSAAEPSEASEAILMQQLNELGATRIFWFSVPEEETQTGLAVFFRGDHDNMVYRFESVGTSREAVLRSVHQQASRWKAKNSADQRIRQKTDAGD